jgi:hypothetical protein
MRHHQKLHVTVFVIVESNANELKKKNLSVIMI